MEYREVGFEAKDRALNGAVEQAIVLMKLMFSEALRELPGLIGGFLIEP